MKEAQSTLTPITSNWHSQVEPPHML